MAKKPLFAAEGTVEPDDGAVLFNMRAEPQCSVNAAGVPMRKGYLCFTEVQRAV